MKRNREKSILSMMLCMVLVLSGLITPAKNVEAEETTNAANPIVGVGTSMIVDPTIPASGSDAWTGSYVYFGNYDTDSDGTAEPVKYRVLDASTTDYSADGTIQTMLLDCDSVLYRTSFDEDAVANEEGKYANDWSVSNVKNNLNGLGGFIDTAFTDTEKNAIATSTKAAANTLDGAGHVGLSYKSLAEERIFLLDAKEATRITYGYSGYQDAANREKKLGNTKVYYWLRSAHNNQTKNAGYVWSGGFISNEKVSVSTVGVSPALNLKLSSILLISASGMSKSSTITSESNEIGTTTKTEWKLTLNDTDKKINLTEGKGVTKASNGTITVPYTYTDNATSDSEKVNQISVMITDKVFGSESTQILYYGALDNVKNAEGTDSTVAEATTGTGTFALPSSLIEKVQGEDYYIYLLAEHVNADNSTDYASEPLEIEVKTALETIGIPSIDAPIAELPLETELEVSEEGVSVKAFVTWKKGETKAIGNAELNATYQVFVKLTAKDGYTFIDASGVIAGVTLNGKSVDSKNVTLNDDGTLTVACGEYKAIARKITEVAEPTVPTQFASYYTAENVLTSTELGATVKVTLQGSTQPNSKDMKVAWTIANENDAVYDATPSATNTFKWTVTSSEYETYDANSKAMEGTMTIQNKASTPVTVEDSQVSVNDDGTVTYVAPINKSVTTVTIPDVVTIDGVRYKVTAIDKNAFRNSKIKKIIIGNDIETIGANAFYGCKKLKIVKLGKNVVTIGDKAFYKCTALTKITIPSKVKTIGKQAFYGCKKLNSVTIGKSVTKISSKAFYGCRKLKTLTIKSKKLTTKKIGSKAFGKTPKSMKVKIPKKKFKTYKSMLIKRGVNKKAKFKKI